MTNVVILLTVGSVYGPPALHFSGIHGSYPGPACGESPPPAHAQVQ